MPHHTQLARPQRWDERLYPGLRVPAISAETRATLIQALGVLGVEAEHLLDVVTTFTAANPSGRGTRAQGEGFLWQLEGSALRLRETSASFEMATQAFLADLVESLAQLRPAVSGAAKMDESGGPWWPSLEANFTPAASIDLCLRQCGFSYRHAVVSHLAPSVEALAENLTTLLHALSTLPPAGVLPSTALHDGLYELARDLQGHVVPHLLGDMHPDTPGLLSGIRRLRELDATEDRSITADLTWARARLEELEQIKAQVRAAPTRPSHVGLFSVGGLFRRASRPGAMSAATSPRAWIELAEREWRDTITALEAIRSQDEQLRLSMRTR
jgi:hypothetical protein